MKKGSTFLLLLMVVMFSMVGVFFARDRQANQGEYLEGQATEAPREVSGGAVAKMPTARPAASPTESPTASPVVSATKGSTTTHAEPATAVPTVTPVASPTALPKATTAVPTTVPSTTAPAATTPVATTHPVAKQTPLPTRVPSTSTPVPTPQQDEKIAGVTAEEVAAVAEFLGVEEEEVELVLKKAAEKGQEIDADAIMSGEVDIMTLWGVVTDALGEKRSYELLVKVLGSGMF